jgi:hypothetical protein
MITGIRGKPYVNLEEHLDLSALPAIHDEVCLALTKIPVDYTGGSHRSMGIVPPSLRDEPWKDYGEVIRAMSDEQFATFRELSDDPRAIDPSKRDELEFGEERDVPLSRRQMLWLEARFGVYFPWKVFVELIPNRWWGDKAKPEGKSWSRTARAFFPKTIAFVESLPLVAVGRCNIMGLHANDFGTVHRDGDPATEAPSPFITIAPMKKRLFLWDEETRSKHPVDGRAYWFNDCDYHGVDPDPFFRYSIRVDGELSPDWLAKVFTP